MIFDEGTSGSCSRSIFRLKMAYKYLIKTWKESLITFYIFSERERAAVQFIKIKACGV
jgi:hypothetical protein